MKLVVRAGAVALLVLVASWLVPPAPAMAAEEEPDSLSGPRWLGRDAPSATVPYPYVYEPIHSWVGEEVQRQLAQGNLTGINFHARGIPRSLIAARVAEALREGKRSVGLLRLARELAWEGRMMELAFPFRDTPPMLSMGPPASMIKLNGLLSAGGTFQKDEPPDFAYQSLAGIRGLYWHPSGLGIYGDYLVTQVRDAALYGDPVVQNTDVQFVVPRAVISWHGGPFELWFGHENSWWGPGRSGGLLVGGGTDPYNQLGYRFHLGTWGSFTAIHLWLSQALGEYAAFHRAEANLGKGLRIGIAEGVRYDGTAPDPLYLVNLVPYAAVERTLSYEAGAVGADRDSLIRSNALLSGDLYWGWSPGWAGYGEILIDDIKTTESGVPTRIAYQLGLVHVREGARRLTLQAEYSRVYNFVYSTFYGRGFYYRGTALGYPKGADVADLGFWADLDLDLDWTVGVQLAYTKIGEGNRGGAWCPPELAPDNPYDAECQAFGEASGREFAGVVQQDYSVGGGATFAPRDNLRFQVEGGVSFLDNADHVDGETATRPFVSGTASWRW